MRELALARNDVNVTFMIRNRESLCARGRFGKEWYLYPNVRVNYLPGDETLIYKLSVYATNSAGDHEGDRNHWRTFEMEHTWICREKFLEEASDLLQYVPRQIHSLGKLECAIVSVKYDRAQHFIGLPGSVWDYLTYQSEMRGFRYLLSKAQNGNQ